MIGVHRETGTRMKNRDQMTVMSTCADVPVDAFVESTPVILKVYFPEVVAGVGGVCGVVGLLPPDDPQPEIPARSTTAKIAK